MTQLEKDLKKIREIKLNWDYPSLEKLIEKYRNTKHTEIKEVLYDVLNNWFALFAYDYECEKVREDKQAYIEDNLLYIINLISKLKPNSHLELDKCYWLQEIATLVVGKDEKGKWLQNAYNTIENAEEVYGRDIKLMSQKISLLLQWEDVHQSAERRQELDLLVNSILDSLEKYPFLDIMELFVANFWMSGGRNAALCRSCFQIFLDRSEQVFSNKPELRMDLAAMLTDWYDEENKDTLRKLELINTYSHQILLSQTDANEKHKKIAKGLLQLSNRLNDRHWKIKISLLAEEYLKLLHLAFPDSPKYISDQITLYDRRIMDELSHSKEIALATNYYEKMHELINQSLAINKKYNASSFAKKLKKCNHLLFQNGKADLNKQAIELYHKAIEQAKTISMEFGTEVFSFSTDDRNQLAECYLLQGNSDKAWEVVQEHALMLEKQKKEYKNYSQYDLLNLLEKKNLNPYMKELRL